MLAHLPSAGAEVVRCAFRLGMLVDNVSQSLEARSPDSSQSSWAYVVTGISEAELQRELDDLNKGIAAPSKLFVSASNHRSTTVSGPPSRLKLAFRESDVLRYSKFAALPVYSGICHAPHIYTPAHVSGIIGTSGTQQLITVGVSSTNIQSATLNKASKSPTFIPILSTESGRALGLSHHVLEDAVWDILTRSIRMDNITNGILDQLKPESRKEASVHVFQAPKNPFMDLEIGLEKGIIKTSTTNFFSWINAPSIKTFEPRQSSESPIAIVGMACRFPGGGDDLDSFWEILEKGRDVHRTVPADRFDVDSHYDLTGKMTNSTLTPYGCFINEPGLFDAAFFNMSAREALETDPMHRLALVTAYEVSKFGI